MNANNRRITARFAPETRFEVRPLPAVPFRGALETALDELVEDQVRQMLKPDAPWEFSVLVRRAASESASLAWLTPYPLLVFPELFVEVTRAAVARSLRQDRIRKRTAELLAA
jgi:hypothetical protein